MKRSWHLQASIIFAVGLLLSCSGVDSVTIGSDVDAGRELTTGDSKGRDLDAVEPRHDLDAGAEPCLSSEDCEAAYYCANGICVPDVCEPGDQICDGQQVLVCRVDGGAWDQGEACGAGWSCKDGACVEEVCEPGATWCEGVLFFTCSDDGLSTSQLDCAAQDEVCTDTGCQATVCQPGEQFCVDEGQVAECNEDGTDFSKTDCANDELCDGGQCVKLVCEPFTAICEGNVATLCNGKGTGAMVGGEVCVPGESVCVDGACVPCSADCSGKECGDDGCGGDCGVCAEGFCAAGQCVDCWDGNDDPDDGCNNGEIKEWTLYLDSETASAPVRVDSLSEGIVVSWSVDDVDGDSYGVVGRTLDEDGVVESDVFPVNTWTLDTQGIGAVAGLDSGGFIVVWQSSNQDAPDGMGVFAQRFDAATNKLGYELQVNTTTAGQQANPRIDCGSGGHCLVVWTDEQVWDQEDVRGQWMDHDLQKIGEEFQVSYYQPGSQEPWDVLVTDEGGALVVWLGAGPGDDEGVFLRAFDSDMFPLGPEVLVNNTVIGLQNCPRIASAGNGGALVVWPSRDESGDEWRAAGRLVSTDGIPLGDEIAVSPLLEAAPVPEVTALADGRYLVTWTEDDDIYARYLSGSGSFQGSPFQVNSPGGDVNFSTAAAISEDLFVVFWVRTDSPNKGIYGQLFNGAGQKVAPGQGY